MSFDALTAVTPLGDGRYATEVTDDWWGGAGAHGGFVGAAIVRALQAELDDPARSLRSLTMHFARAPQLGPIEIAVAVEMSGRQATTLTARLEQAGKIQVLAVATHAAAYPEAIAYATSDPPRVPLPEGERRAPDRPDVPKFARALDLRPIPGTHPYAGSTEPLSGGWIRLVDPHPIDAPFVALAADAYWPAVFTILEHGRPAPTIDLTLHVRATLPLATDDPHPWLLTRFTSRTAREGFFEEDGEQWSADGTLVAQSRQLALLL